MRPMGEKATDGLPVWSPKLPLTPGAELPPMTPLHAKGMVGGGGGVFSWMAAPRAASDARAVLMVESGAFSNVAGSVNTDGAVKFTQSLPMTMVKSVPPMGGSVQSRLYKVAYCEYS